MKILHISPYFAPAGSYGGAAGSVYRLCLNLARLGCEVRVLTTDANGPLKVPVVEPGKPIAVAAGLEVTYTPGMPYLRPVSSHLLMRLLPEVRRADLVHLTGVCCSTTIPTLIVCRLTGKPLVWSPGDTFQRQRGNGPGWLKRLREIAYRIATPRLTTFQLHSEFQRTDCARCSPNHPIVVIPIGVRLPARVKRAAATDDTLRLGYLGRLHPRAGIENLLEACRVLNSRDVACSLVIAGAGHPRYHHSLTRKIEALGLARTVRMVGEVQGKAQRAFFEDLDLLVMPSQSEAFASAVAQSLASGVPVIASRGTPWQRLEEKGCGLWVENDPESLAQAVSRMRTMPLAEMGRRGREWMATEFSWDTVAREVCSTYATILRGLPIPVDAGGAGRATARARGSARRTEII